MNTVRKEETIKLGINGFRTLLLAYAFFDGLILIYPVYLLQFREQGLGETDIAALLMLWPIASLLFELPSGYMADRYPKKTILLLAHSAFLACLLIWYATPSYLGYGIGLWLWGMRGAFTSGTFRAFLYEEMEARTVTQDYVRLFGRLNSLKWMAMLAAYSIGPWLFGFGFELVLFLTVFSASFATCLLIAVQRHYRPPSGQPKSFSAFANSFKEHVLRSAGIRWLILFGSLILGFGAVEEFWPLFGRDVGLASDYLGLFLGSVIIAQALGELAADKVSRTSPHGIAGVLILAGGTLLTGVVLDTLATSLGAVVIFAFAYRSMLTANAGLLQMKVDGSVRASAASLAGFGSNVGSIALFYGFGRVSELYSVPTAVALSGAVFTVIGVGTAVAVRKAWSAS